jgi:tetratricopeptide (TPR) repeat protein
MGYYNWGHLRMDEQRPDDAIDYFERSAELLESMLEEAPHMIEDRYRLALCRRLQGDAATAVYTAHGSRPALLQSLESLQQALSSLSLLILMNPDVLDFLEESANIELNLSTLWRAHGQLDQAVQSAAAARTKFAELAERAQERIEYRVGQAVATKELGLLRGEQSPDPENLTEMIELLEESRRQFERIQEKFPKQPGVAVQLQSIEEWLDKLGESPKSEPETRPVDF